MRVALIHDWLTGMRGGERCLEVFVDLFPQAEIYTLFYNPAQITPKIREMAPVVSSLGKLPGVSSYYRPLLPLYPSAARDLGAKLARSHAERPFDLVLSISHCAAKNVPIPNGVFHLSYCLTPVRYLWDKYDSYFAGKRLEPLIRPIAKQLRNWDSLGAHSVKQFIAISEFVRSRIQRVYGRTSAVIYPPVRTDWIKPRVEGEQGEAFLCVSALVPYKNVDVIIEAFNRNGLPLRIIGTGPEEAKLRLRAKQNIRFLGKVSDSELAEHYRTCRALVFGAEEDFGMVVVEAQAAGRPVIALGSGGVLESVRTQPGSETGLFVSDLSAAAFERGIRDFLENEGKFTMKNCVNQASQFSLNRFSEDFGALMESLGFSPFGFATLGFETGPRSMKRAVAE